MFTLYNKQNKKQLTHPRVGVWYSDSREEAKDMLRSCHDYLRSCGLEHLVEHISVERLNQSS